MCISNNKFFRPTALLVVSLVFNGMVLMATPIDAFAKMFVSSTEQTDTTIYYKTEVPALFSGGNWARVQYLFENLDYPEEALEQGIQGTVYVSFVVEADGSITNVNILSGIGGGCDEEVVRLVSSMPRWAPGRIKGKPVRSIFRMPVKFALRDIEELQELQLLQEAEQETEQEQAFELTRDAILFVNGQKQEYNLEEFDKKYSIDEIETIDFVLDGKGMEKYGYPNVIVITTKR